MSRLDLFICIFSKVALTILSLYIPDGSIGKVSLMYEINFPKWFKYYVVITPFDAPMNAAVVPLILEENTRLVLYFVYGFLFKNEFCFNVGTNICRISFLFEMLLIVIYMIKHSIVEQRNLYFIDKKYKP